MSTIKELTRVIDRALWQQYNKAHGCVKKLNKESHIHILKKSLEYGLTPEEVKQAIIDSYAIDLLTMKDIRRALKGVKKQINTWLKKYRDFYKGTKYEQDLEGAYSYTNARMGLSKPVIKILYNEGQETQRLNKGGVSLACS